MNEIAVGIFGASGSMGSHVREAVTQADGMRVVAGVDVDDSRDALADADVLVDFTNPDAVMENIAWGLSHGKHLVVGTSGFTPERLDRVRELCAEHPELGVLIASNFSIGAVLMMKFADLAAPYYSSVEIVELHHPRKADAPSGTATATAQRIAAARDKAGLGPVPDATVHDGGARGADVAGVRVHGVRLQGLVAHQEVLFGDTGETLTIRHDSYDRVSFMPGVVASISYVMDHPGLTWGIESVLGI